MKIANLIGLRFMNLKDIIRFAIRNSTFAILFLFLIVPVLAQTSATRAPGKVTVTLVRWPYT